MAQNLAARRTPSLTGSSRLALSVGKGASPSNGVGNGGRHPLKHEWSISYVYRPPGAKVEYEKEIRRVATFGSIESFLQLYSHLTPPNELPAVTDLLVFLGRIGRPGVWEEMRDGGKFTLRLLKPITPLLFESLVLALIGDQFEESDAVVGCVLSVRDREDILSLWVEEEADGVRSGALKEKILTLLNLPSTTMCEYRSNRALLEATALKPGEAPATNGHAHGPGNARGHAGHGQQHYGERDRDRDRERGTVNGSGITGGGDRGFKGWGNGTRTRE
ncbi:translation initiation factor eIF 4e-like domain-containing protein [Naematelia encephala]|uniref:Translation initiation factor eIF 4e-like domain-containing protein n=1 Tax=Naematelia encephala TaxID=71784 RepID=A0A1Y2BAQ7_9TREE|nr:translation initiation factor eIF 4e-like domain-containing protein [Naematelia encephala]